MKRIRIILLISILLLTLSGCGNQKLTSDSSQKDTTNIESTTDNQENANKDAKDSTITNSNKSEKDTDINTNENSLKEKVIDYIINGQENMPEAEKIKWNFHFYQKNNISRILL